ncbi:hypothetical protein MHPYR_370008 [uncultured Mycobacterium sp.]|uniref:Uncharacterized protein n=1 Tax=uncultured Mycobacterium sp. TaxID=171292 RepID=A0A1Y5PDM7_9MYCO|nr:hypothetical protein MHPYR_370008 [uncultured Mycobacterium sp.]
MEPTQVSGYPEAQLLAAGMCSFLRGATPDQGEARHGCAQAQNVAVEHPQSARAVEGRGHRSGQRFRCRSPAQGSPPVAQGSSARPDRPRQALTLFAGRELPARAACLSGLSQALGTDW